MKTYNEAVAETLDYFEREHRAAEKERLEALIEDAKNGDRWVLGQLHLRSLTNGRVAASLAREPELLAELERPIAWEGR